MSRPEADLLAQRYGTPSRSRRRLLVGAVVVLAVVFLGWLAWAAWFHSNLDIRAEIGGYDVVDAHEIRAKVDVVLGDDDVDGTCLLRASAADHSIVGELNLRVREHVDSGDPWVSVRTEREATSVSVARCTAD